MTGMPSFERAGVPDPENLVDRGVSKENCPR